MKTTALPDHLVPVSPPDPDLVQRICAVLIGAGKPTDKATIAHLLGCNGQDIEAASQAVRDRLAAVGLVLLPVAGLKWVVVMGSDGSAALAKLNGKIRPRKQLSGEAAETLALIQENGPLTRKRIEQVRGADTRNALATLLKLGLITVSGRALRRGGAKLYVDAASP